MYMFNYVYLYTGTFFSEIFLILREKSNPIVDGKTNPANPVAGKVVYQFIPLFPGFFFYTSKTVVNRLGISELLLMEEILHHLGCIKPCK